MLRRLVEVLNGADGGVGGEGLSHEAIEAKILGDVRDARCGRDVLVGKVV